MKTMTCEQLGGACALEFKANSFKEIAEQSKKHGMEMFQSGDVPHVEAMQRMQELMQNKEAMMEWFSNKEAEFNALSDQD